MKKETEQHAKRNYKDTLFRMIFSDKSKLLELYNAINGTEYTNPDLLEIVTLENAIYMNMKNDLAFLIDFTLNLYEHQSTFSPNMPLRNLFYIAREFEKYINQKTIYSSKLIPLPTPRFVVFYNGPDMGWSREKFKLSDAYMRKMDIPELELVVTMININYGENDELFEKCHTLWEYMIYVEKVRRYSTEMEINQAVKRAVAESIEEGILKEFLMRFRAEAVQMSIFEYDEEREIKLIREDERDIGREEGIEIGREAGRNEEIQHGIEALIRAFIEVHVSEEQIFEKLQSFYGLNLEEAREQVMGIKANLSNFYVKS